MYSGRDKLLSLSFCVRFCELKQMITRNSWWESIEMNGIIDSCQPTSANGSYYCVVEDHSRIFLSALESFDSCLLFNDGKGKDCLVLSLKILHGSQWTWSIISWFRVNCIMLRFESLQVILVFSLLHWPLRLLWLWSWGLWQRREVKEWSTNT